MAVPILAAAGAAAARAAGTQIAKQAAAGAVKTAAKSAAKEAAKNAAKNMIKQKAKDKIANIAGREAKPVRSPRIMPIPSPSIANQKTGALDGNATNAPLRTAPETRDIEELPSRREFEGNEEIHTDNPTEFETSIQSGTNSGAILHPGTQEASTQSNTGVSIDSISSVSSISSNSDDDSTSYKIPETNNASTDAASVSNKSYAPVAIGGLAGQSNKIGANGRKKQLTNQDVHQVNPPQPSRSRGALRNSIGKPGGLLNKGSLNRGKQSNPLSSAGKSALAAATVLNPFFWLFVLGFIGFVLIVMAVSSFLSMLFGGLFGGSDTTTIENSDTTFIPTVNITGAVDPCANLTTDSAREAAGCNDDSSGGKSTGDWVYYNQCTPNWDTADGDTWGDACGLVAYAMILSTYGGPEYTPDFVRHDIFGYSGTVGASGMQQGKAIQYVNDHQDVFGLVASDKGHWCDGSVSWDEIERVCDAGGCVQIYQTTYSSGGRHWIVVKAVDGDDVTIANPATGAEEVKSKSAIISGGCPNGPSGPTDCLIFEKK